MVGSQNLSLHRSIHSESVKPALSSTLFSPKMEAAIDCPDGVLAAHRIVDKGGSLLFDHRLT